MRMSLVVPARNAASTIEACLRSILQEVPAEGRDVLVVDNGSQDDTLEIARRFPVRIEVVPPGFVSRSRNTGARLARHPVVAFVDSDCTVLPGWYGALSGALDNPHVAVAGCRHTLAERPTWVERAWDGAHRKPGGGGTRDVPYVPAGNMAVRRAGFLEAGGFDETLETGEDPDLCARMAATGGRVVEVSAARAVHHGEPKTLRDVFRRERWHGRGLRLRYGDGRLAPIAVATVAFAFFLVLAVSSVLLWPVTGGWMAAAAGAGLLLVAGTYAARYARDPFHFTRLLPIYFAYFGGRVAALPVAAGRGRLSRPQSREASLPGGTGGAGPRGLAAR